MGHPHVTPPRNKAVLKGYSPQLSLHQALLGLYFLGFHLTSKNGRQHRGFIKISEMLFPPSGLCLLFARFWMIFMVHVNVYFVVFLSPKIGEDFQFDENIFFQVISSTHQLDIFCYTVFNTFHLFALFLKVFFRISQADLFKYCCYYWIPTYLWGEFSNLTTCAYLFISFVKSPCVFFIY